MDVVLVGTVQGLVAEAARVREAFEAARPRAVALGVSPEAAGALLRYQPVEGADPFDDLPDAELAFAARLQEYGDVALPPPDLLEAVRLAREAGVPVYGADLPEERYEEVFAAEVSAWGLLRYGRVQRKLAKRPPAAPDARAFALAWDARLRRIKGLDRVERAREAHVAATARSLARQAGGPLLLVVDAAREPGVRAHLEEGAGLEGS
ncbi:MAG: hypothetical protein QOE90_881 [Thermoplasmata archaeon]|jgi:hypothetical protein|nr:hypothetical protein [Thermoplasmata archaeon]